VYCANYYDGSVTVIDGASNQVLRAIEVGDGPRDFTWNPAQNRVYCANYGGSSISVLRDSASGVEEGLKPQAAGCKPAATVIRSVLRLPVSPITIHTSLFDMTGRQVMALRSGPNDVSKLSPGVYFVREEPQATSLKPQAIRKVVLTE
jgi:YVTN family beta-propeller protein